MRKKVSGKSVTKMQRLSRTKRVKTTTTKNMKIKQETDKENKSFGFGLNRCISTCNIVY